MQVKRICLASVVFVPFLAECSSLQDDLQSLLNEHASSSVGLQLGWKSEAESFTIAAGSVTNPGSNVRAIQPNDTFNYGSCTKATIATAIMRLVDAGKIKLHDKVSSYVNPFLERNNGTTLEELYGPQMAGATILHVLRMEAGLPDFESAAGSSDIDNEALASRGEIFTPYRWMRAATSDKAVCKPGSCSFYSSLSYEVAGLLLVAVQSPEGDWVDLDFVGAISHDTSRYPSMKMPADRGSLKDHVSVVGLSGLGGWPPLPKTTLLWNQSATIMGWSCGGMNANAGDVANFFYDLLSPSSTHSLVSSSLLREMSNMKPLDTGNFKVDYGAGLMDSCAPQYNQPTTKGPGDWGYIVGHIGETFAFHSISGYMPKANASMSIVTNADAGMHTVDMVACIASEIAAQHAGERIELGCPYRSSQSPENELARSAFRQQQRDIQLLV